MKTRSEQINKLHHSEQHRQLAQTNQCGDNPVPSSPIANQGTVKGSPLLVLGQTDRNPTATTNRFVPNEDFEAVIENKASERHSYQVAKSFLKKYVHSIAPEYADAIRLGSVISKCLIFEFDDTDIYNRFLNQFYLGIRLELPNKKIKVRKNVWSGCIFDPSIFIDPHTSSEKAMVCINTNCITFSTEHAYITFRPFDGNDVLLSEIIVDVHCRNQGVGKSLMQIAKSAAQIVGCRIVLFPTPPATEQITNPALEKMAIQKLRKWYAKLGFVNALPEMKDGIRLGGDRKVCVGICGLMVFK